MVDYNKRLVEVDEILNYLSEEDLLKIPENIRREIKENKDKEYIWKYDETKSLKEQDVSRDAIVFLSFLNMEYLLNETQKAFMKKQHESNEKKLEEAKAEKYSVDDLFKSNKMPIEEIIQEQALVEYKERKWYDKIFEKILSIFRK